MAFPPDLLSTCWFLAGPTACGKTAVSLHLAEKLNAEIIALDSMTLYRGMDIGTAKPSPEEQSLVPHHLIDILDPHDEFSLAEYLLAAEAACRDIISRGRTPLFVGGTGMYLKGLLRGVFEGPAADWILRRRFEDLARREGSQSLWDRLLHIDAQSARRLHPNDQRRIIRALEVFELTGQPLSALQTQKVRSSDQQPRHVYWIAPPRDWLYRRIDERVEQMFAAGLLDEIRSLLARPASMSHTARQALGYKEVIDWLEKESSHHNPEETRALEVESKSTVHTLSQVIQTRTRQFAKRQHTWFRNLEECRPIVITGSETAIEIAETIVGAMPVTAPQVAPISGQDRL